MSPRSAAPFTNEHLLLALLDHHPTHGYDLYQALRQEPGIALVWNVKQSMMYVLLERLEQHGWLTSRLVSGQAYPPRKLFTLTEEGRAALHAWMIRPVRRAREMRQEFLVKLIVARRYDAAQPLLLAQQRACLEWQAHLREELAQPVLVDSVDPSSASASATPANVHAGDRFLVLSYRAVRVESILAWINACLQDLPDA